MATFATCSYHEFTDDMGVPVQASLGRPKFPLRYDLRLDLWAVTPRGFYLRSPFPEYEAAMTAQLDYGVPRLRNDFARISRSAGGRTPVILCFERLNRPGWCHRTIVREWWARTTGEVVPELGATHHEPESVEGLTLF